MDGSAEPPAAVVELGSSPSSPEAKRRRRCVQSKLSWGASGAEVGRRLGTVAKVDEESEEAAESEGDGRRKPRRKGKTQSRGQKKSPVASKESRGSVSRQKSSCALDEKSLDQKPKKEQADAVALKMGKSKRCKALDSTVSNKNCQQLNKLSGEDTPRKASKTKDSNLKKSNCKRKLINGKSDGTVDLDGESPHQPTCDLWLEAKKAAEENMRLSAGKQMHPFFTCRTTVKKVLETQDIQDIIKVESRCWSSLDGIDLISSRPVHVFDTLVDDLTSLDWQSWVFTEKSLLELNSCCDVENASSVFGSSVKPLSLDSVCHREMHHQVLDTAIGRSSTASATASPIPCDGHDQIMQPLSNMSLVQLSSNISLSSNCHRNMTMENEHADMLHKERLISYSRRRSYWPQCSLWTDKYRPNHAAEVCGNSEAVRSLGEWLKFWHEKGQQSSQKCKTGEPCSIEDSEDSSYANESDVDDGDEIASVKNVLLITGPVGSGKTAAIYACAKEQGFEVLEVNASDLRNGAYIKQKFGEATESHGFNRWSVDDVICSKRKSKQELLPSQAEDVENHVTEMVSEKCAQDLNSSQYNWSITGTGNKTAPAQVADKTLILFEDVDTVFDEDRGFISTILQLAETTKRPIIITSNNKNPILPQLLDRLILDFKRPSPEELLSHLQMICAFEMAQISSHLLDHLVRSCLGDIRKTLMLLQYWCEGKKGHVDIKMQCTYSPLLFDIDAAHLVMPRVIPWELRSELSEKVAEAIDKTIPVAEKSLQFLEAVEQQELNLAELMDSTKMEEKVANTNKTKKRRKLKKNYTISDFTEFPAHANGLNDFSDDLESPMRNAQQTVKHRPDVVLSSQSDDALCADDLPPADITSADRNNHLLSDNAPKLQKLEPLSILELPTESAYQSRTDANQSPHGICKTASVSHVCDTFRLEDVSFVPESSFMPGTEVNRRDDFVSTAVSSNSSSVSFPVLTLSIGAPPGDETNNQDGARTESNKCLEFLVGDEHGIDIESVHGNEDLGNSQNEDAPSVSGYQLMDECSQAAFSMRSVPTKCDGGFVEAGSVQETWTKLRSQCADLRSYLTNNQKEKEASLIVNVTSALADLVCETELMLSNCDPVISDILEPTLTPAVEPDSSSWYDEQLEMGSAYAQHGLCFYSSKCEAIGSVLGLENKVDLAQEMLASSTNSMALGKLLIQGNTANHKLYSEDLDTKAPRWSRYIHSIGREVEPRLFNAILPIIPARSCMTLRGPALHEYVSFIGQISKLEFSRLAENINRNTQRKRRSRASQHYLNSGSLSLSPESIELLAQSNCFKTAVP